MSDSLAPTEAPFIEDHRGNPRLHRLYVIDAMEHLTVLQESIEKMRKANINWMDARAALFNERSKLLITNEAYKEAAWRLLAGQTVRDMSDENNPCRRVIYDPAMEMEIPEPPQKGIKPIPEKPSAAA